MNFLTGAFLGAGIDSLIGDGDSILDGALIGGVAGVVLSGESEQEEFEREEAHYRKKEEIFDQYREGLISKEEVKKLLLKIDL